MISICFFGSSVYSIIILQKILSDPNLSLSLVVTKTDKPQGRQKIITPNPVADFARQKKLPLLQIEEFSPDCRTEIINSHSDIGLCVAFGPPFFDEDLINIFPLKIVNIHPSDLPKYRGASPAPWQIINGENKSQVTFFQIDPLPDHGPIIAKLPLLIDSKMTSENFYQKAFTLAAQNLSQILTSYSQDPLKVIPQDHTQKSYYPKFTKESAQIDWSWPVTKIERFVRALLPWPIAWTQVTSKNGQTLKMKIYSSEIKDNHLNLKKVQIEGKNITDWSQISDHYQLKT
jgi:methionyl-tRNA formyltransferase